MRSQLSNRHRGFTLIEVMVVLAVMGLAVSYVMFNAFGVSAQEELEKEARRFQVLIEMASDFAVLNQRQLGMHLDKDENTYQFVWLDEEQNWQHLEKDNFLTSYTLPEQFSMELSLDDLPWEEEDSLFDEGVFDEELSVRDEGVSIGDEAEQKPPPPQVLLFSSGEITPFIVSFIYEPGFSDDEPVYFRVVAKDVPPLTREGPLDSI